MRRLIAYDVPEEKVRKVYFILRRYAYPYQRSVFLGEISGEDVARLLKELYPIVHPSGHLIVVRVKEIEYELGNPYRRNSRDMLAHRFSRKNSYLDFLDTLAEEDERIIDPEKAVKPSVQSYPILYFIAVYDEQ